MVHLARGSAWLIISVVTMCGLASSCSDSPALEISQTGTLGMTLTGTAASGAEYRLRNAIFIITGSSSATVSTEDDPGADSISIELKTGEYSVALASGWSLERAKADGTVEHVEAMLVSSNPQSFTIVARKTTNVRYRFKVAGEMIEIGGNLSIGIDIEEPQCDGGGCPCIDPTCAPGAYLDLVHSGESSTVHAILQDVMPAAGERVFTLPPLTENLTVMADGMVLSHEIMVDPNVPETQVRAIVPGGTTTLRLVYDILDGSLPYEGLWYLRYPIAVGGPRQVRIQLPYGAAVQRLDWPDSDPDPLRVAFQIAQDATEPFVVYSTPQVPDLYDHIDTPHFTVNVAQAHRRYQPAILGLLENLYALYGQYTGQDVNEIQRQARYSYSFPPAHWRWGGVYEIGGGLSIKGLSTVNGALIPQIGLPTSNGFNLMVAITAHELGNGWWGTWEEPDPENHTPAWIDNEGHSGFLRAQGELDLGYCEDARRENAAHYQDFVNCTNECGGETVLVSLQHRLGWPPLRAFYAAVQHHDFDFRGMSEVERSSVVIRFLSEQIGRNLVPFFDAARISMTQAVRDELTRRFSPIDVPILSDLECRPSRLRVVPDAVHADVSDNATSAHAMAFACAPGGWSATLSPSLGLSLLAPPTNNCGTVTVDADLTLSGFGEVGQVTFCAPGLAGSPQTLPVIFTPLLDLLKNGDFEQPFDANWIKVAFIQNATFTLDDHAPKQGRSALLIEAPEENDARLVQTVTVKLHTRYRLSGWIRTENVGLGLGANLTIEWPGSGWEHSRGVTGTTDWTFVTLEVDSGSSTSFEVQARLGHYGATSLGRAWFDGLRLEAIP